MLQHGLFVLGKDMMKKWKTLRDNFVREVRLLKRHETGAPATKKKKYIFFDQLSFLLPYVKGNDTTVSNIPPPEQIVSQQEEDEENGIAGRHDVDCDNDDRDKSTFNSSIIERQKRQEQVSKRTKMSRTLLSASKNIASLMQESINIQMANTDSDKSGNKAFLMSFVPIMDSLPPLAALEVRMKITEVFGSAVRNQSRVEDSTPVYPQMMNRPSPSPLMLSGQNSECNTPTPTPAAVAGYDENSEWSNCTSTDYTANQPFNISEFISVSVNPGVGPSSSNFE